MTVLKVGDNINLKVGSNITNFNVEEVRGVSGFLIWCTHGDWDGIYDLEMKSLTILSDSYGWMSEDDRVMRTIFGVELVE